MTLRLEIVVDEGRLLLWHRRLCARIEKLSPGAAVRVRFAPAQGAPWPGSVTALMKLERVLLRRRRRETLFDPATPPPPGFEGAADVVVDLTGAGAEMATGVRMLRPRYGGYCGELSAVALLLQQRRPELSLEDVGRGAIVASGFASMEAADGLTGGLESIASRIATLIEQALISTSPVITPTAPAQPVTCPGGIAAFLLRDAAFRAARMIYRLTCNSPHWRIGWRFIDGPGALETGSMAGPTWRVLAGGDNCFAADPFPIARGGKHYIFYESLDYATDKGVICAQQVDADGPVGTPVRVLEEPWHLSYPFLIEEGGTLYMIPEASVSGAISVYRCVDFPGKWECVARLFDDVEAADATIFRHAGRFWMTSVTREGVGGYSDTLRIHYAPDLFGRWEEHARRPALVDARFARPAGAVVEIGGHLLRPVQDCAFGYGKRTIIMRIDALDAERFEQTQVGVLAPGDHWPGTRLHTINRSGRLECVDGAIITPRNPTLRALAHRVIDSGGARHDPAPQGALETSGVVTP